MKGIVISCFMLMIGLIPVGTSRASTRSGDFTWNFKHSSRYKAVQSAPVIASISPTQTPKGTAPSKITLKGSGFVTGATVFFNVTNVSAKIKSDTKIVIKNAPSTLFQSDQTFDVKVITANGQSSNTVKFIVGTGQSNTATPASIVVTDPETFVVNTPNAATPSTVSLKVSVLDKDGNIIPGAQVTFQSLNAEIASVSADGVVTGISPGAATIQIASGTVSKQVTFDVNELESVSTGIFGTGDLEVQSSSGIVFASDFSNHVLKIRRLGQAMIDYAGKSGVPGNLDGFASNAMFNGPLGVTIGEYIYLADTNNQSIRRINTTNGECKTLITLNDLTAAANVSNWGPRDIAVDSNGDLYVTDAVNHVIWQVNDNGDDTYDINLLAGSIGQAGSQDGTGQSARFDTPQRITLQGNILNVTENSSFVRQVALPSGEVKSLSSSSSTVELDSLAGTGVSRRTVTPNGNLFSKPVAIAADSVGNLYVADSDTIKVATITNRRISIGDLSPKGTFKSPIAVAVTEGSALVLDGANGKLIQIALRPPSITSATPNQFPTGMSVEVTLKGKDFNSNTQVLAGPDAKIFLDTTFINSQELRFTVPAQRFGGSFTVTARNRGGKDQILLTVLGAPAPASISLSAFPDERKVAPGKRTTFTLNVGRTNFSGPVNLSALNAPKGINVDFNPDPVIGPINLVSVKVNTIPSVAPGKYTLQVVGRGDGIAATMINLTVNVVSETAPSASLSVSPTSQTISQGDKTTFTITINRKSFSGIVNLSANGVDTSLQGVLLDLVPNQTVGSTSVLTVNTSKNTPTGKYTLRIKASADGVTIAPVDITLTINPDNTPTVRLAISPSSQSVTAGASTSFTITATTSNYSGIITRDIKGTIPTGVTFSSNPQIFRVPGSLTLTVSTSLATSKGSYNFQFTGNAPGVDVNAVAFTLVVQ